MFKVFTSLIFIYSSLTVSANRDVDLLGQKIERLINNDGLEDALKTTNEIRKDFKKITAVPNRPKPKKKKMVPADTQSFVDMEVCVGCNEIAKLTDSINKILAETQEAQDPKSGVALELNNLVAVTTIVQTIKDKETDCFRSRDLSLSEKFVEIEESDLVLEFSQELDATFDSGQFYNRKTQHKTIWLRGTGKDLDKIVRVDIDRYNKRTLSYYRLKDVDPTIVVREEVKKEGDNLPTMHRNTEIEEPSFEDKTSGNVALTTDFQWESDDKKDYLKMTVGPELKYKYYLPKSVKVLSIEAENEVFDQYVVQSNASVDEKDQEAQVRIINKDSKKELIRLKATTSKTTVDIPYEQELIDVYGIKGNLQSDSEKGETLEASIYNTSNNNVLLNVRAREEKIDFGIPYEQDIYGGYNVKGIIGSDTLGAHRVTASVSHGKSELFNTDYTHHANGNQSVALGSKREVHTNGTLSVKLRRDIAGNIERDSAWLNYEVKF
jgi:hypothetical protein